MATTAINRLNHKAQWSRALENNTVKSNKLRNPPQASVAQTQPTGGVPSLCKLCTFRLRLEMVGAIESTPSACTGLRGGGERAQGRDGENTLWPQIRVSERAKLLGVSLRSASPSLLQSSASPQVMRPLWRKGSSPFKMTKGYLRGQRPLQDRAAQSECFYMMALGKHSGRWLYNHAHSAGKVLENPLKPHWDWSVRSCSARCC